jgi:carbohydrate kinase (thermoresistant glucokinase family)
LAFYEADDFHSSGNVEKIRGGVPLMDEDRWPWLENLRELLERKLSAGENAVLACSALKRKYRERLRAGPDVKLVFLRGDLRAHCRTTASQAQSLHESGVTAKSIRRFGGTTAR